MLGSQSWSNSFLALPPSIAASSLPSMPACLSRCNRKGLGDKKSFDILGGRQPLTVSIIFKWAKGLTLLPSATSAQINRKKSADDKLSGERSGWEGGGLRYEYLE